MNTKLAYLGPQGTYAEKAAINLVQLEKLDQTTFIPCKNLLSVIEHLAKKLCDLAVVPIENSVEGGVTASLDGLWSHPNLFIKRAIVLPIRHSLISSGELEEISEVLSHPQALAQCSGWLSKHLPNALLLPTNSTAEAVRMVAGSRFRGAIASRSAKEGENLKELAFPINDVYGNRTRFILLQREKTQQHGNLASIAFSLHKNSPGALLEALSCISKLGLNMSRIESRPSKRELGEYVFFIDIEIDISSINIEHKLEKYLKPFCENLVHFGSYLSSEIDLD
tara:strand:- start:2210 stop:3052 length:843 start_codon:yes stop_codon:yes gene_type:complete